MAEYTFARPTDISIHAPLRERLPLDGALFRLQAFQSTLPHGSDHDSKRTQKC